MTDGLADIRARIDGIRQLHSVVNAMRGIAGARVQQARNQLAAVDSYSETIAASIGQALMLRPEGGHTGTSSAGGMALVLFCAEQGFAGAFSERVIASAGADVQNAVLFLVGTRGATIAAEQNVTSAWAGAMPPQSNGIPKLADLIGVALYSRLAAGEIARLDAIFSQFVPGQGVQIQRRRLFPLDLSVFPRHAHANAPLVNLHPAALLSGLVADYVHAQLCNAALHAFAAENQARMESMAAARSQIERQLDSLNGTERQMRQESITTEIIELAAGETAGRRNSA